MTKYRAKEYVQVIITGKLITKSPLHCGDGELTPAHRWISEKEKEEGHINTVCKTSNKPYIPASTLRGSLRDRYIEPDKDNIFGTSHGEKGTAGKLRIYDALSNHLPPNTKDLYQHTKYKTTLRDGVAIDPVTQTAENHALYTHEIVPAGSSFTFQMEIDQITEEQLKSIIKTLKGWNGSMSTSIGKGRSKGWGKVQLENQITIRKLSQETLKHWVENTDKPEKPEWERIVKDLTDTFDTTNTITFSLSPSSPLLVNDHSRFQALEKRAKGDPSSLFMCDDKGNAIIPGSTLKGVTKAHAHRIMATIAHLHYNVEAQDAANIVKSAIETLFGAERKRSTLWFEDAVANTTEPHPQFFNAVDRFTGGVSGTALYNVIAANCDKLDSSVTYDIKRMPKGYWWKGLLLLVVRDFMEDGFTIGWGKAKGYGFTHLNKIQDDNKEFNDSDFNKLVDSYSEDVVNQWINSLHEHIKSLITDYKQEK